MHAGWPEVLSCAHAAPQVLYNVKQRNFPKELFEVRMYALKPRPPQAAAAAPLQ